LVGALVESVLIWLANDGVLYASHFIRYPFFIAKDISFHEFPSSLDDWSDFAEYLFRSDELERTVDFGQIGLSGKGFPWNGRK
jgi:hypothetical protein